MSARHRHGEDDDDERPRWRDADDDDDAPRDCEVEPEEEKEDRHAVLSGTMPLARVVFFVILGAVVLGGVLAFVKQLGRYFGH